MPLNYTVGNVFISAQIASLYNHDIWTVYPIRMADLLRIEMLWPLEVDKEECENHRTVS